MSLLYGVPQNFPHAIAMGLENKKLTGRPRTKFITIIAQSIYRFKSYPTDEEYIRVVREIVEKWPFLDDGKGLVRIFTHIPIYYLLPGGLNLDFSHYLWLTFIHFHVFVSELSDCSFAHENGVFAKARQHETWKSFKQKWYINSSKKSNACCSYCFLVTFWRG